MAHTIIIQELDTTDTGLFRARVSFNHASAYEVVVSNPFAGTNKEADLEWYFEEWPKFTFINTVKAEQAAVSVREYGEALFGQVFKINTDVHANYCAALNSVDFYKSRIEIVGSPEFHALHWEAMRDPARPDEPLVTQCTMLRKNLKQSKNTATVRESASINVLVITARPFGESDVGYRTISRPLTKTLRDAKLNVTLDLLRPATLRSLHEHLASKGAGHYHVLHFDTHGALWDYPQYLAHQLSYNSKILPPFEGLNAFIFLDRGDGHPDLIHADDLAALLQQFEVPLVVLNACQSGKQIGTDESSLGARLMQAGVQNILAMSYSVTVTAAMKCMTELYRRLFEDAPVQEALRYARIQLHTDKGRQAYFEQIVPLEDWLLPVLYENQATGFALRQPTADETRALAEHEAQTTQFGEPTYGFFGRDLDVLRVERLLHPLGGVGGSGGGAEPLLIYGMGGMGKSSLLRELARWWTQTRWIERTFYFGWDTRAWTRQQIMHEIARAMWSRADYERIFMSLDEEAQQDLLCKYLRERAWLLILDNLESVRTEVGTAYTASMTTKHSLSGEELGKLRAWVDALRGGKTRVLLGSRGREDWLCTTTYELRGLDAEAASDLAEAVLKKNDVHMHDDDRTNMQRLITLLAGVPLALTVILPNLRQKTAAQVLKELAQGNVALDAGQSEGRDNKDQSILRCIEYSYQQMPVELQGLLMCLAPFVGVANGDLLIEYSEQLKMQPALTDVPFEQWGVALSMAKRWGLLSAYPEADGYVQLQPVLPYFLRRQLTNKPERFKAIEQAFYQYYTYIGFTLIKSTQKKQPEKQLSGLAWIGLEYENFSTALEIGLANHDSIINLYYPLDLYIDATHDHIRGLVLGQQVQNKLMISQNYVLRKVIANEIPALLDSIAKRYLLVNHYIEAEQGYHQALSLATKIEDVDLRRKVSAVMYHQLGVVAQEQRQWVQAEKYYKQALQIKAMINDRHMQAASYGQLGRLAQEQHQWAQAERYFQQALQIYIEFDDRRQQAATYQNLGIVVQNQHRRKQAEVYYLRALRINREFYDRHAQAKTYDMLGSLAQEQQEWTQAKEYYLKALKIKIEFKDRHQQAITYHHLGLLAQEQHQWEQSERYYQQALLLDIESKERYSQANAYGQLGMLAQAQRQWAHAKTHYMQALTIFAEYNDQIYIAFTIRNLARLWRESDDESLPLVVGTVLRMSAADVQAKFERALDDIVTEPTSQKKGLLQRLISIFKR